MSLLTDTYIKFHLTYFPHIYCIWDLWDDFDRLLGIKSNSIQYITPFKILKQAYNDELYLI